MGKIYTGKKGSFKYAASSSEVISAVDPIIKEVIVEKIVIQEVPVIKEVEKEVIKVEYVIKEVPVEVIKEKEIIKEVPKIEYITKEVEVVKEIKIQPDMRKIFIINFIFLSLIGLTLLFFK